MCKNLNKSKTVPESLVATIEVIKKANVIYNEKVLKITPNGLALCRLWDSRLILTSTKQ